MTKQPKTPKSKSADHTASAKDRAPAKNDELSTDELDKAAGGLVPAVGPQR